MLLDTAGFSSLVETMSFFVRAGAFSSVGRPISLYRKKVAAYESTFSKLTLCVSNFTVFSGYCDPGYE